MRVELPINKTTVISSTSIDASFMTAFRGSLSLSSSKSLHLYSIVSLVIVILRSLPPEIFLHSTIAWSLLERSIFAFSQAFLRTFLAVWSFYKSIPETSLNSIMQKSTNLWSMSLPPSFMSPLVAATSIIPSEMHTTEISRVPPPKSNTTTF